MDAINEAFQRHQSRRKFLGNISIIGFGASGANFVSANGFSAQAHHTPLKRKREKNESNCIKR
jgi:hypothetical protein